MSEERRKDPPPRRVLVIEPEGDGARPTLSPQDAPPPPDAGGALAAERAEAALARRGGLGFWASLLLGAGGLLVSVALALSVERMIAELFTLTPWLGWAATALAGLALVALLALIIRELGALGRLRRVEGIRHAALEARESGETAAAKRVASQLQAIYASRKDLEIDWRRLRDQADDGVDAAARLALYERKLMAPLDEAAAAVVRRTSRRVATITAIAPSVLLDAIATLYLTLAMIRRLAEIYGGRAGLAGTLRLARRVVEHAMAIGLIALTDDLIEPLLGGGVASKVSRRLGEGVVNGAMTARLGLAAMEVSRPLPFHALDKPTLRALAWDAARGR
ncbi:MAG: TIGR01620 family protein [Pseudomonadota bacterium]